MRRPVPHFSPPSFPRIPTTETIWAYPRSVGVNWVELAQRMAEEARAGVAADRKRLQEILAERQRKQVPAQSSSPEDEETLAAIDEGIRDAKDGRAVPTEEVRKQLPKWTAASSKRKER